MALSNISIIMLLFLCLYLLSPLVLGYTVSDVKLWCNQTPYPQPCEYFLSHDPKYNTTPIKHKSDFLKVSLNLALKRALRAQLKTYKLGYKCKNGKEKAAWADCIELYELTIQKLKKTVEPGLKPSQDDAQTWLSTALTNLQTCVTGFHELGVTDNVLPLIKNNVTALVSNTLSLNNDNSSNPINNTTNGFVGATPQEFPTWVGESDRKLLQTTSSSPASKVNVVVAQDGSGNYKTLAAAISAASKKSGSGRYVIYVKAGTYKENVQIKTKNIMLIGDGIGRTIITGSKSVSGGSTTFASATVVVTGERFIAQGITVRNTAGPQSGQAVALRSGSDLSVFYKCSFEGYQDTLYVHSERQFYKECDIYGTVDFIFGNAAVVLQNCNIYGRKPPHATITLTAQGRTDPNQNTGIIIHNCRITAASDLRPVQGSVKAYLGRPWQAYSRTVYMKNYIDNFINPAGWMEWTGNFALNTLYYAEYANTGPGSSTAKRVKWKGYHVITSPTAASKFTVANFIAGNSWLPSTKVPFTSGL